MRSFFVKAPLWLLPFLFVALFSQETDAGTRIDNVVLEVDPRGRAMLTVTNIGSSPLGYVLTPYEWEVENGEDVYRETSQFMAVPPTFQLAPDQSMTVRVGFRNPTPARTERTFRLSVQEVPTVTGEEGLAFAFNHFLPVYIAPTGGRQPAALNWSINQRDGQLFIRATNQNNSRAVLRTLIVNNTEIPTSARATVHAQNWREFPIPSNVSTTGQIVLEYELATGQRNQITISR